MRLIIEQRQACVAKWVARYVKQRILGFGPTPDEPFVMGISIGPTATLVFNQLVEFFAAGELSFANVVVFCVDAFVGLEREHRYSRCRRVTEDFASRVDIPVGNVHTMDGNAADLAAEACRFEGLIQAYGGLSLVFCGTGWDGHLALNEPGSSLVSRTRVKTLANGTRRALEPCFRRTPEDDHFTGVPQAALTLGVGTIMDAHEVIVMFVGVDNAQALYNAAEAPICHLWPVSVVQAHPRGIFVCDNDSTQELEAQTIRYFKGLQRSNEMVNAGAPATAGAGKSRVAWAWSLAAYMGGSVGSPRPPAGSPAVAKRGAPAPPPASASASASTPAPESATKRRRK